MKRWLVKSEPDVYSIADLARDKTTKWEGVRNYQARNFLREMTVGDLVFFYHSNAAPPAVAGIAEVSQAAAPDPSQFDPKSRYFDPKSPKDSPRWSLVELRFKKRLSRPVPLDAMKKEESLKNMDLITRGRLSVQPVSAEEWRRILAMAGEGG